MTVLSGLRRWNLMLTTARLLCLISSTALAGNADIIVQPGVLRVGVKKDVPRWGWQASDRSEPEGLEVDLARDLAKRMHTNIRLVGLRTADRIPALLGGQVDILIATLSDTAERRKEVHFVMPHYYASGANVMTRKQDHVRQWTDLRNRRVCARRGAFYNRALTVDYEFDLIQLYGNDLSQQALLDGRCQALLHDDLALQALLINEQWSNFFEMKLPSLYVRPWAIALPLSQAGSALDQQISRSLIEWHKEGLIEKLQTKWGIDSSAYVRNMSQRWLSGQCGMRIASTTPKECL